MLAAHRQISTVHEIFLFSGNGHVHNIGTQKFVNTWVEHFSYIIAISAKGNYSHKLATFPIRKSIISKSGDCITLQLDFVKSLNVTV